MAAQTNTRRNAGLGAVGLIATPGMALYSGLRALMASTPTQQQEQHGLGLGAHVGRRKGNEAHQVDARRQSAHCRPVFTLRETRSIRGRLVGSYRSIP